MGYHATPRLGAIVPFFVLALGAAPIPTALQQMADTERAFARRAAETTVRDAFIAFFADESIAFEPDPVNARESLRKRPPSPVRVPLLWEPRYGDIATSGDLGYLTGPSERTPAGQPPGFGAYFSVWKRQPDGEFRVILDVGIQTPARPPFAPAFTRAEGTPAWHGSASRGDNERSLMDADTAFAQALAADPAAAYRGVLHETGRLMRNGIMPLTTRREAEEWLASDVTHMTSTPVKAETGAAGNLGYTWGRFTEERPGGAAQSGHYVRIWTRKADGTWQLVADVTAPRP